jgi:hypothetical protein
MNSSRVGGYISSLLPAPLHNASIISKEHFDYLQPDNPELIRLKNEYSIFENEHNMHSQWDDDYCTQQILLPYFRGDNAYIWQIRNNNSIENYNLTTQYLLSIDKLNLFEKTIEDGSFGVFTYPTEHGLVVSRDLLDSINELYFLENILGLSHFENLKILDIGAGYGRLGHRAIECFNNIELYTCTDAVAESTFICNFYTHYRGLSEKCQTVSIKNIEENIAKNKPDLAVNIHSFSECTLKSIKYWLNLLSSNKVKYLMIAPNNFNNNNGRSLISMEKDLTHINYESYLSEYGYNLMAKTPKYLDSIVQAHGVSPTYYYLYELAS